MVCCSQEVGRSSAPSGGDQWRLCHELAWPEDRVAGEGGHHYAHGRSGLLQRLQVLFRIPHGLAEPCAAQQSHGHPLRPPDAAHASKGLAADGAETLGHGGGQVEVFQAVPGGRTHKK